MSLSHQQKVYIPKEARTNQYITAEIKVTDELLSQYPCLLYTSPSPRDRQKNRMPSSA